MFSHLWFSPIDACQPDHLSDINWSESLMEIWILSLHFAGEAISGWGLGRTVEFCCSYILLWASFGSRWHWTSLYLLPPICSTDDGITAGYASSRLITSPSTRIYIWFDSPEESAVWNCAKPHILITGLSCWSCALFCCGPQQSKAPRLT